MFLRVSFYLTLRKKRKTHWLKQWENPCPSEAERGRRRNSGVGLRGPRKARSEIQSLLLPTPRGPRPHPVLSGFFLHRHSRTCARWLCYVCFHYKAPKILAKATNKTNFEDSWHHLKRIVHLVGFLVWAQLPTKPSEIRWCLKRNNGDLFQLRSHPGDLCGFQSRK